MHNYVRDDGSLFKEHVPQDIPDKFPQKEVYEHKSETGQEHVERQNVKNHKANDRYKLATQFLQDKDRTFFIERQYSISFYVDSSGHWEYYPKKDRLHGKKENKWYDNGFSKMLSLYK